MTRTIGMTFVLGVVLFLGVARPSQAASCDELCATYTDCPDDYTCPICAGMCTSCRIAQDAGTCADAGTGSSTRCKWTGSECVYLTETPEIPAATRPLILAVAAVVVGFLFRGRLPNKSQTGLP